jgi:hypothetical protein
MIVTQVTGRIFSILRSYNNARQCFGAAVFLLFTCNLYIFWPGSYSVDSLQQWNQAKSGEIANLHPAVMAGWWRFLYLYIWQEQGVLLAFHVILFWSAMYVLGRQIARVSVDAAYLLLLSWCFPTVLCMTYVLWKDSGMAFCFFLASALMLHASMSPKKPHAALIALILLLMLYATAVRHNALFALPALCFWLARYVLRIASIKKALITALALFAGLTFGAQQLNEAITNVEVFPSQEFMLINLAFMSDSVHHSLFPEYVFADQNTNYETARKSMVLNYEYTGMWDYHTDDAAKYAQLKAAFWNAITSHPAEYVQYRFNAFWDFMRYGFWPYSTDNMENHNWVMAYLRWIDERTMLFKPWVWMLSCLTMLAISAQRIRKRRIWGKEIAMLNLSAMTYVLPFAVLAPSDEVRYIYWMILTVVISTVMLVADWDNKRRIKRIQRQA